MTTCRIRGIAPTRAESARSLPLAGTAASASCCSWSRPWWSAAWRPTSCRSGRTPGRVCRVADGGLDQLVDFDHFDHHHVAPTTTTTTTTIAPTTTAAPVVGDHMVFADGYPLGHIKPDGFAGYQGDAVAQLRQGSVEMSSVVNFIGSQFKAEVRPLDPAEVSTTCPIAVQPRAADNAEPFGLWVEAPTWALQPASVDTRSAGRPSGGGGRAADHGEQRRSTGTSAATRQRRAGRPDRRRGARPRRVGRRSVTTASTSTTGWWRSHPTATPKLPRW